MHTAIPGYVIFTALITPKAQSRQVAISVGIGNIKITISSNNGHKITISFVFQANYMLDPKKVNCQLDIHCWTHFQIAQVFR